MNDDLQFRGHGQLFYRGAIYLTVAFVLVLAEFACAVLFDVSVWVLMLNDTIAGFICWRTRRILFPLAAAIIDRFGDAVHARRAFAVLLMVFGLLFLALQVYTVVKVARELPLFIAILFIVLQLFSAYTGYLMMQLGGAIWHGREPDFANRARKRVEELRGRLLARRKQAQLLQTLPDSERMRAFSHAEIPEEERIYRSVDARYLAFVFFGILWYGFVAHSWERLSPFDRVACMGVGTFGVLLGVVLWYLAKRRSQRVYLEISAIGIRCIGPVGLYLSEDQGSRSFDDEEVGELAFLWGEFFHIQASPVAGSICFRHYAREVRVYVREEHFNVTLVRKRLRTHVDSPDLLAKEADLMNMDEFYLPQVETGTPTAK